MTTEKIIRMLGKVLIDSEIANMREDAQRGYLLFKNEREVKVEYECYDGENIWHIQPDDCHFYTLNFGQFEQFLVDFYHEIGREAEKHGYQDTDTAGTGTPNKGEQLVPVN